MKITTKLKRWKSGEWGSKASKNNEKMGVGHNKINKYFENNGVCIGKQKKHNRKPTILYKEGDDVMIPGYVYDGFGCKHDYWGVIKEIRVTKSGGSVLYNVFAGYGRIKRIGQNTLKMYERRFSRFTFKECNETFFGGLSYDAGCNMGKGN